MPRTIYPFVVSMAGREWDALIHNLNEEADIPENVMDSLRKKRIVILDESGAPRLFDPVSVCVDCVSNAQTVASVECPTAALNHSAITVFFYGRWHIFATRDMEGENRLDFLLSEADASPLESFMELAQDVAAPGTCEERFLPSEKITAETFNPQASFFRCTFLNTDDPEDSRVYALYPRSEGGAWLARSGSNGARQGELSAMLARLRQYLQEELNSLTER